MHKPKNKTCTVEGCSAKAYGKPYCRDHLENQGKPAPLSKEQRSRMRSNCCNAKCTEGEQHEYGKQYCDSCKEPCLWHPNTIR